MLSYRGTDHCTHVAVVGWWFKAVSLLYTYLLTFKTIAWA